VHELAGSFPAGSSRSIQELLHPAAEILPVDRRRAQASAGGGGLGLVVVIVLILVLAGRL